MNLFKIKKHIPLLAILGVGAILRLYNLTARALWHDEAFSALLIKYNFKEMIDRIILDVHPPFYYIVLRSWNFILGDSLFSLRLFSVVFSLLIIWAVYLLAKTVFKSEKIALFSALLVALNSFQIQYAHEARMYALSTFLIVISTYFIFKALYSPKQSSWKWWALYILAVIPAIYSHYYVFFSVLAQFLFAFVYIWHKKKNFKLLLISYFVIAFSYLPWLKVFLKQLTQVQESYWIPKMTIWSIPCTFYKITTGTDINIYIHKNILVLFVIAFLGLILYGLIKDKNSGKWLIFLLFAVPFLGAAVLSLKTSIYLDRYFIFVSSFYLILISIAILKIPINLIRKSILALIVLLMMFSTFHNWDILEIDKKPGMAEAAAYLNQEAHPNHKIYVGSSFVYFTFKYYNKTGIPPLLYCSGELSHFSGTALLSSEDIIKDFETETKTNDIVWMINTTGFGNYRPEVPQNWVEEEEKRFQDAYDYQGWIVITKYRVL